MRQFAINELKSELKRRELSNVSDDEIQDLIHIEEIKNVLENKLGYVPNEIIDEIEECCNNIWHIIFEKHWFYKKVAIEFRNYTVKEYYIDKHYVVYKRLY